MRPVHDSTPRVLFLGGWGRSGSTLLGNLLNEMDSFFHVGELTYVWENGWLRNRLCGCGEPFHECVYWKGVAEDAFGGFTNENAYDFIEMRDQATSNRRIIRERARVRSTTRLSQYAGVLARLYRSAIERSGKRVLVDSSKLPIQLYPLLAIAGLDVRVLHLVRDPRATAYSWQKKIMRQDVAASSGIEMEQIGLADSAIRWSKCNYLTERLSRHARGYMRVRYEDLVSDPIDTVAAISSFAGVDEAGPFADDGSVSLTGNHTAWGNPSRSRTGPTQLRLDDKWRSELAPHRKIVVSALALPLLARYGYLTSQGSGP